MPPFDHTTFVLGPLPPPRSGRVGVFWCIQHPPTFCVVYLTIPSLFSLLTEAPASTHLALTPLRCGTVPSSLPSSSASRHQNVNPKSVQMKRPTLLVLRASRPWYGLCLYVSICLSVCHASDQGTCIDMHSILESLFQTPNKHVLTAEVRAVRHIRRAPPHATET